MQLAIASFIASSRKQKLAAMSMSGKCEAFDNLFKFGACVKQLNSADGLEVKE